jgi:3',5'-cyclic AMP phosphodiesterase CpdA
VTVVPGNHDAYVKEPWAHTFALWGSYMDSDPGRASSERTGNSVVFPSLRVRGPLALIGLSSACPTAPFFATGSLGQAQLQRLDQLLVETEDQGLIRTLLIHHPPMTHTVAWRKRLTDSLALRQVLMQRGVELVLHGHAHRFALEYLETSFGKVPVIGVPSASCIGRKLGHRAQFNLYHCNPSANGWNLEISIWSYVPARDCFVHERTHTVALPS